MHMDDKKLPIIFIGFMGTGKSTIGDFLSLEQKLTFVDLDSYIEIKENKSIPEIFNQIGESGFRQLEYKYLKQCMSKYDVISTGGGIIENDDSLKFLKQIKHVIWLDCSIDTVYRRILNDPHRPNAKNKTKKQLKNLYLSRISRYNEIAFMKVNSEKTIKEIYDFIINHLSCG
ncbi:shikimate kinase [Staphylococcus sp. NRL 16/872]|uniref:shikimate kinase n=1 Tax=Staphylococcus sp. NRL 16/872 TaxID=2930131 RepID=UPI001FB26352|nr:MULTISPECIES: shikimate kinase [unclassified Staphylococcus]MCJ1656283.1 shikimate kinase [Staphylococcus sp. NRL 21/187]MCJ1668103.1 shikimate kinase [Staphylococcus sp. NRL 19/737]WEN70581.1 shikimate kinase [Staphylococcus sp. NRL 16/872]